MKKNILIVGNKKTVKYFSKNKRKHFKKANIIFIEDTSPKEIHDNIINADALIDCPRRFFDNNLLSKAKKLKWVHIGGAGIETFLFPEFVNSNIILTNGKQLQGPSVADHAIALLLTISRNIHLHVKKENIKKMKRPIELRGKTCGVLGLGGIGFLVSERLKSFGMNIIGFSEDLIPLSFSVDKFLTSNKLYDYLPILDVVICCAPLTKKTEKLFNDKYFKKMKKDSIFINVSRGKIVDTNSLIKKSIYTKLRGIGLDVTDPEPLTNKHKLKKIKNIILSNHTAGPSDHNRERSNKLMIENLERFINNDSLLNIVDKVKGY